MAGWGDQCFADASNQAGDTNFSGISPTRIIDNRTRSWGLGPLQSGYKYVIQLVNSEGCPLTIVIAFVVNVRWLPAAVAQ